MIHPLIKTEDDFEPSADSKRKWLSTKKSKLTFDDLKLNGLFRTSAFRTHTILVLCVVGIEFYGIYILFSVLTQPLLALLFTGLDFILAVLAHLFKNRMCYAKNIKTLAKYGKFTFTTDLTPEGEIRKQNIKIFWLTFYEWFFRTGILIVAAIKIYQTLIYGNYIPFGQLFFICVLYVVAAVIHIFVTGYFLSEIWFRYGFFFYGIRKELLSTKEQVQPTQQKIRFYRLIDLGQKFKEVQSHKHEIVDSPDGQSSILKMWGILQDDDLDNLASHQGSESKALAIKLLRIQLKNVELDAQNHETGAFTFDGFLTNGKN